MTEPNDHHRWLRAGGFRLGTGVLPAIILAGVTSIGEPGRDTVDPDHALYPAAQDTAVSFSKNVFPIIQRSCVECHGAAGEDGEPVVEEGLNMLTYDGLMAGSLYGKVIEPGNAEESYLIELVAAGDMPKEGDALTPEEIELIRRWINSGAPNN